MFTISIVTKAMSFHIALDESIFYVIFFGVMCIHLFINASFVLPVVTPVSIALLCAEGQAAF